MNLFVFIYLFNYAFRNFTVEWQKDSEECTAEFDKRK